MVRFKQREGKDGEEKEKDFDLQEYTAVVVNNHKLLSYNKWSSIQWAVTGNFVD